MAIHIPSKKDGTHLTNSVERRDSVASMNIMQR
jgi:hypothetical protein